MLKAIYIKGLYAFCLMCPLSLTAQGIRIPAGAYVIASNGNFVIKNNWINNGTFTANGGTIVFAGATQQISGTKATFFNNLLVSAGSSTTILSDGNTLRKILKSDGSLTASNNFTLLATPTQTALIDGSGIGNILGIITMQGYLANGFGYKYLGAPFQQAKVSEMADDVNLLAPFASVYKFDESLASNGWVSYTDSNNIITPFRGFAFQLGNNPAEKTIDMNGVVNNGNLSITLKNNNQVYTKGFQLLSNPYPSPINWDAVTGWTRTNVDNAIYYFDASASDQYGGTYNSYINQISSDGNATSIIPAMQAFFVHVSNGTFPVTGMLGISNAVRITSITQPYRHLNGGDPLPLLRLRVSFKDSSISDPVVLYFQNSATDKFDKTLDALKLLNTTRFVPSLYTIKNSGEMLSIDALPLPDSSTRIPLGIQTRQDGELSFFTSDITALPANLFCYFYDAVTGKYQDLTENKNYPCYLPAGTYENRFSVVFSRKTIVQQPSSIDPSPAISFQVSGTGNNRHITLIMPAGEKAILRIINTAGQVLYTSTYTFSGKYPLNLILPQGIYYLACYIGDKVITKQIFTGQ